MLFFVCVLVLFFGSAPGSAPYIYIYIYIYMAFRMHLRRGLRQLFFSCAVCISCVCWSFLNAIMPLYMQAIFFSLSISLIFPLCSPHIFYVLSGHSLDRPAPVIPIVSWLVIFFTFPLPPPYASNICPKRDLRQACASHFLLRWCWLLIFPYIVPMFCYFSLYCSDVPCDCSSFSYIFHYYSLLSGD